MNITITSEKENPLLARKEIEAKVVFEGSSTPSRKDIQTALAKKAGSKEDMTIIKTVATTFGSAEAKITACTYSDEKTMLANERKNLVEKHTGREPKKEEGDQ